MRTVAQKEKGQKDIVPTIGRAREKGDSYIAVDANMIHRENLPYPTKI
jgi:hypothetical protein